MEIIAEEDFFFQTAVLTCVPYHISYKPLDSLLWKWQQKRIFFINCSTDMFTLSHITQTTGFSSVDMTAHEDFLYKLHYLYVYSIILIQTTGFSSVDMTAHEDFLYKLHYLYVYSIILIQTTGSSSVEMTAKGDFHYTDRWICMCTLSYKPSNSLW